jgi:tRNA-dihydrouridine synthase
MQDVTDLPFWRVMARHGGPDVYYTEYFRVHATSNLEPWILDSLTHNPTGRPAVAQMIGNDIPALVRTACELQKHPVAAIDLNLGCPAPIVYRKCAGGGLLREPKRVDSILGALRDAIGIRFTVKTRIGFDTPAVFDELLEIFERRRIDLLTVHGRTVSEGYRSPVHHEYIGRAARRLPCPVVANGNIYSAARGLEVLKETGARGLMVGRGAIRNPWMFDQFRAVHAGRKPMLPTGRDVLAYVRSLYEATRPPGIRQDAQVEKMKKYMNFIGLGLEPTGEFLHAIRRVRTEEEFFQVCTAHMDHDEPLPLEPFDVTLPARDLLAGEHR